MGHIVVGHVNYHQGHLVLVISGSPLCGTESTSVGFACAGLRCTDKSDRCSPVLGSRRNGPSVDLSWQRLLGIICLTLYVFLAD